MKKEEDRKMRPLPPGLILGSDVSRTAVKAAAANLASLPHGRDVEIKTASFQNISDLEDRVIVCNPPYGIRTGDPDDTRELYKAFGDYLKNRCKGSNAYIYFGERKTIGHIGLRPSFKKPLSTGGLDGRLAKFEIY